MLVSKRLASSSLDVFVFRFVSVFGFLIVVFFFVFFVFWMRNVAREEAKLRILPSNIKGA